MRYVKKFGRAALFIAIVSLFAVSVNAQTITSATSSTALNLTIGESLTVAATPSSINFTGYNYAAGTATASAPISVVTSGNFSTGHTYVVTWAYLGSTTAALAGPANVSAADVFASVNGAAATPCSYDASSSAQYVSGVLSGAVCPGVNGPIGGQPNPPAGIYSQTDTVALTLAGATNLVPGTYSGTITFVAAAF
jgi:hypothetical protein